MTTIVSAAAWRANKTYTLTLLTALTALAVAGCETSPTLFGSSGDATTPVATDTLAPQPTGQKSKIAIAPVIGAPDTVAKLLQVQLGSALEKQKITVAKQATDPAEYTLRGYIVSAKEKTGTKVSYIWDVTDPTGKRVNRVTGEEIVAGGQGKDPWAAVTPQTVEMISAKTAGQITTWLPTQSPAGAAAAAKPIANNALPGSAGAAPVQAAAATAAAGTTAAAVATAGPTTGSIARAAPVTAMVPSVTGAPGDGGIALTTAIQRELTKNGVALTSAPGGQTYQVEGKVAVGQGKDGKQPIQIDWHVKDPTGKKLGTVSQKNEIQQGSLDGAWGKTADMAAAAAAQGILKLLPQSKVN